MALSRSIRCRLALLVFLAGCATGSTEYRAGLVLHRNPDFSFQIPPGWRPAKSGDWMSFGANQRVLQRMNEYGKAQFQRAGESEMSRYAAVLISSRGSWISAEVAQNQGGIKFPSGYALNESEKATVWQAVEQTIVAASPATDKPKLTLDSMDVVDFGPNTVLRIRFQREDQRGLRIMTVLAFYSAQRIVVVLHCGIPGDPNEGINGLDVIARSFRFE
jgi:hypothetical protein